MRQKFCVLHCCWDMKHNRKKERVSLNLVEILFFFIVHSDLTSEVWVEQIAKKKMRNSCHFY